MSTIVVKAGLQNGNSRIYEQPKVDIPFARSQFQPRIMVIEPKPSFARVAGLISQPRIAAIEPPGETVCN